MTGNIPVVDTDDAKVTVLVPASKAFKEQTAVNVFQMIMDFHAETTFVDGTRLVLLMGAACQMPNVNVLATLRVTIAMFVSMLQMAKIAQKSATMTRHAIPMATATCRESVNATMDMVDQHAKHALKVTERIVRQIAVGILLAIRMDDVLRMPMLSVIALEVTREKDAQSVHSFSLGLCTM